MVAASRSNSSPRPDSGDARGQVAAGDGGGGGEGGPHPRLQRPAHQPGAEEGQEHGRCPRSTARPRSGAAGGAAARSRRGRSAGGAPAARPCRAAPRSRRRHARRGCGTSSRSGARRPASGSGCPPGAGRCRRSRAGRCCRSRCRPRAAPRWLRPGSSSRLRGSARPAPARRRGSRMSVWRSSVPAVTSHSVPDQHERRGGEQHREQHGEAEAGAAQQAGRAVRAAWRRNAGRRRRGRRPRHRPPRPGTLAKTGDAAGRSGRRVLGGAGGGGWWRRHIESSAADMRRRRRGGWPTRLHRRALPGGGDVSIAGPLAPVRCPRRSSRLAPDHVAGVAHGVDQRLVEAACPPSAAGARHGRR